jgi:hypothetical protein
MKYLASTKVELKPETAIQQYKNYVNKYEDKISSYTSQQYMLDQNDRLSPMGETTR